MSQPQLIIRAATPADWAAIVEFNCRLAEETEGKCLSREKVEPGVQAVLEDSRKGRYVLAELGGEVIGQLMLTWEWSDWRNGNIWWFQSVYVHPDHRRRGVFRSLYQAVLREARRDPGVVGVRLYVEQENTRAQSTYRELGMKMAGYFVMEDLG